MKNVTRAATKRFKMTGSGKVRRYKAFKSHILTKKTSKRKRRLRQAGIVATTGDTKRVKPPAAGLRETTMPRAVSNVPRLNGKKQIMKAARGAFGARSKLWNRRRKPSSAGGNTPTATARTKSATSAACGSRASTPARTSTT